MAEITTSQDVNAPAAAVWSLLADYGNIQAWWPKDGPVRIARVKNEGQGVGMIRHIYNEGFPKPISERLDHLDAQTKTWKLSIVGELPPGMNSYNAIGTLTETGPASCRIDYKGVYSTDQESAAAVDGFLRAAYALMFRGLKAAAER
ncbi:MAG: SRPBCC family protein [Desulfuromonadales bacterium]|nr:SRPBCC family protein [Desulfuromonadales bacterium]